MDAPGFASPLRNYQQNLSKMRESNDPSASESSNLCSLGVVDLDLTVCPDVFGLRAFDLILLIPDAMIGQDGFHDVVIDNLIGTLEWRSRHVSPSDVIGLRRRWPQAVFHVLRKRSVRHYGETLMRAYRRHIDTVGGAIARYAKLEQNICLTRI